MDMINITLEGKEYQLDIEQAKKLNLLKEKDSRVRSWKEFNTKYKSDIAYGFVDLLGLEKFPGKISSTSNQLTPHEAQALAAFSKLLKLRRDWIGEWEPDWTKSYMKWGIYCMSNKIKCDWCTELHHALTFPTVQMGQEFLETFHDLIEEAKTLI
jgi:hypothetical protein